MNFSIQNPLLWITLTLAIYWIALRLKTKWNRPILNPVLTACTLIMVILSLSSYPYEDYLKDNEIFTFMLGPSVVALGAYFHQYLPAIKKQLIPFLVAVLVGSFISIISVSTIILLFEIPHDILKSVVAKSVTTPIALEVTKDIGGLPEIIVPVVIITGILGNVTGLHFMNKMGIKDLAAQGVAMGVSAHGIGTAKAIESSPESGVFSGLAMCLNGLITAIITPYLLIFLI